MVHRRLSWQGMVLVVVLLVALLVPPSAAGAARNRFFPQTEHNVADPFLSYYEQRGGLALFGLPLTEAFNDGALTIQYFERARMELHTDFPAGQQVALGQLGRELTAGRLDETPFRPRTVPLGGGTFFRETGHTLGGAFAAYWQANGGLAIFGLPLSEEFTEALPGNPPLTVQYFERARFELRASGTGVRVELGLLGAQNFRQRGLSPLLLAPATAVPDPQPRALTIPVLEYHDVGFGVGTYQVTMPAFNAQLDWLMANGYTTVSLQAVYEYMYEGVSCPRSRSC